MFRKISYFKLNNFFFLVGLLVLIVIIILAIKTLTPGSISLTIPGGEDPLSPIYIDDYPEGTVTCDNAGFCFVSRPYLTVAQFKQLDMKGSVVKVKGLAKKSAGMCTLKGCPSSNKCCNSCSGAIELVDKNDHSKKLPGLASENNNIVFYCSGNECSMSCAGPLKENKEYIVTGMVRGEVKYEPYTNEPYIIYTFWVTDYEEVTP